MKLIVTIALLLLTNAHIAYAQKVWVGGYGSLSCGEALNKAEFNKEYSVVITNWIQGFIAGKNWDANNKMVGANLSSETLDELWKAKCRLERNVPKPVALVADEIYKEAKAGKY